ncbi:homologous recombination OB-fold protein isoform X2 [Hoplias malabaricus]|uniref:homologous recombination OB-fold protein isoform X2 n=1 Tax=Hoplias malabaricus TaxID=27720 RepID=UPI003461D93D
MTAACNKKWSGLFSVGEDFDDEDLLEADWTHASKPPSAPECSALASASLKQSSTFPNNKAQQSSFCPSSILCDNSSEPGGLELLDLPKPSVIKGLRSLSNPISSSTSFSVPLNPPVSLGAHSGGSSVVSSLLSPPVQSNPLPVQSVPLSVQSEPPPAALRALPQDDFDEWDVDLDELDESLFQKTSGPQAALASDHNSPAKKMRTSTIIEDAPAVSSLRGFCSTTPTSGLLQSGIRAPCPSTYAPRAFPQNPLQPLARNSSVCHISGPGPVRTSPEFQRGAGTPRPPQRTPEALFQAISPASSQTRTPRLLHTPVLTNHLVQLVSAANKTPQRPRSETVRSKTRRFPGPAGALPQQIGGRNLDEIVVTVPQTPAHGAVARLRDEDPNSQVSEEEEFAGGPWAVMKTEMGLDERNPSCFLHSYSIVMVLRKAALRQLVKNKVPNMAVVLKSILHTHADAKAVFRDPTGEMQGTVHRRLLEDRQAELKIGAVLLLKQVGVFSPSHRNHYLNVTPNNLLKIYPPDGPLHTSSQVWQPVLDAVGFQCESFRVVGGPVSQMEMHYNEEEDEVEEEKKANTAIPISAVLKPSVSEENLWGADDLDELLGELPVESYSS